MKYGLQCETQERGKKKWPLDNITDEKWEPVHFMTHICAKSMLKFYHRVNICCRKSWFMIILWWRSDPTWRASNSLDRLPSGLECCNSPRRTRSLGSSQSLSILILQQRWPFLYYHHNNHRNGCVVAWKGNFSFINGSWKCYSKAI